MSTQTEITRIQTARDTFRAKAVELGIGLSTDKIDALATKYESNLINQGAVNIKVKEGESITIPKGYHNGSGTVAGIAGGGNYELQAKTVTPTKTQQEVTSNEGYYGLSSVTVNPIPSQYQDVSGTTALAGEVLVTKVFTAPDGTMTTGTMPNNGAIAESLNVNKTSVDVAEGYHNGLGKVSITLEEKSATPTKSSQNITPTTGKVLSKVVVNPIPDNYKDATSVNVVAEELLVGKKAIGNDADGNASLIEGTMPNNGAINETLSTTKTSTTIAKGFHSGSGKVSITLEEKSATPTTATQNITPTSGKVLSKVTVNPIPSNYKDATNVNATAAHVLAEKIVIGKDGTTTKEIEGTMANNGAVALTMNGLSKTSVTIPEGYHSGAGTVSLTNDIELALAAI